MRCLREQGNAKTKQCWPNSAGHDTVGPSREFSEKETKSYKKLLRIPFLSKKTTLFGVSFSLLARKSENRETREEWCLQKIRLVFFP